MPRKARPTVAAMPFMLWNELALHTGEMLAASAQVISHRTGRIVKAGHTPTLRDRREFTRMGVEKLEAANESAWAMGQHLSTVNAQLAMGAWRDLAAAGAAWLTLASSKTLPQAIEQQQRLMQSVSQSADSASRLSELAARLTQHGLKPIHSRATANAKRLAGRR